MIQAKRRVKRLRRSIKIGNDPAAPLKLSHAVTKFKQKSKDAKHFYFNTTLPSFITNSPNKFWRHFRRSKSPSSSLSLEQQTTKANEYNEFFNSVFTKDNNIVPPLPPPNPLRIDPLNISQQGVLNLLLNLNSKKSNGPDNIPNEFLKKYAEWCSRYLVIIYRMSLSTSKLPGEWKIAKLAPIHKSGGTAEPSNFRPISLTCTSCKLLEHIILKHLLLFLEQITFLLPINTDFPVAYLPPLN